MSKFDELTKAFAGVGTDDWRTDEDIVLNPRTGVVAVTYDDDDDFRAEKYAEFIALAHNLMPDLLDAVEMVRYAADVFEGACACGACGPCRTLVKMRKVLEQLK